MPGEPSASKKASCGFTPTAYEATASITPQQKRAHASADSERPRPASPASSTGRSSGSGSSPTSSWLRLRSTASASLSPNAVTLVPGPASRSCTITLESSGRPGKARGAACAAPPKLPVYRELAHPGAALHRLLELTAGRELRDGRRGDLHPLRGVPRVDALAGSAPLSGELADPRERHLASRAQHIGDRVQEGVYRLARVALRDTCLVRDPVDELLLCHEHPPSERCRLAQTDPNSQAVSAQPCGFAAVFSAESNSPARNSGTRRAPRRARASAPPSSRSSTQTAIRHSRPASRTASSASTTAPPEVTTSSTRQTRSPGSKTPSRRFCVPYPFAALRTIRNGSPEDIDAAAASATAPSSGPASRTASGSCSETVAAMWSPSAERSSGRVSKRYLSR